MKAVRAGKAGTTVIQADVGSQDKQMRAGLAPLPHDIPPTYFAAAPTDVDTNNRSRPDFTLYNEVSTEEGTTRRFTLAEIKYCVDTKPQDQLDRAKAQHAALACRLKQAPNTTVDTVVILLGNAGYIYETHTKEQLARLGIQGSALKSLLTNLHVQAIKSLTTIINIRRHGERKQHRRQLKRSTPGQHRAPRPRKPPD